MCEIVRKGDLIFTFIHKKTTPIKDESSSLIFSDQYDPRPNFVRNIRKPPNKLCRSIASYFATDKVFYQDNEVGEIVRNYLMYCKTSIS